MNPDLDTNVTPESDAEALAQLESGFTEDLPEPKAPEPAEDSEAIEEPSTPEPQLKTLTVSEYEALMSAASAVEELRTTQSEQIRKAFGKLGEVQQVVNSLKSQPSSFAQVSLSDFPEMAEEYPDIANLIVGAANKLGERNRSSGTTVTAEQIQAMVQEHLQATPQPDIRATVEDMVEQRLLSRRHRDWVEVVKAEGFNQWLSKKPAAEAERIRNSRDADEVADAIDAFKKDANPKLTAKPQNSRFAESAAPRGTGGPSAKSETPLDDLEAGYASG